MKKSFTESFIENLIDEALVDVQLARRLSDEPLAVFREAGFRVPSDYEEDFSSLVTETLEPIIIGRLAGKPYSSLSSVACAACKIGAFGIATTLVGLGAVGLAALGSSSPIVVALASYAGVSATAALAFIVGVGSHLAAGVTSLVSEICRWAGVCP